jgi:hypothetical protein
MRLRNVMIAGALLATTMASAGASARDNVSFSISLGAAPAPIYAAPAPVYIAPAPAYYPPAPIYSSAPIYSPAPVYYYPRAVYAAPRVVYAPRLAPPAAVIAFGGHDRHGHRWHR